MVQFTIFSCSPLRDVMTTWVVFITTKKICQIMQQIMLYRTLIDHNNLLKYLVTSFKHWNMWIPSKVQWMTQKLFKSGKNSSRYAPWIFFWKIFSCLQKYLWHQLARSNIATNFGPSFQKFNPAIFLKSVILESLSTCIFLKSLSKIRWDFSSYTFKPSWCYFLMETTSVLGNYSTLINIMNKFQMNLRSNIVYISLLVKVQLATLFRFVDF